MGGGGMGGGGDERDRKHTSIHTQMQVIRYWWCKWVVEVVVG